MNDIHVDVGFPHRIKLTCPKCDATYAHLGLTFNLGKNKHENLSSVLLGSNSFRCKNCGYLIVRKVKIKVSTELFEAK